MPRTSTLTPVSGSAGVLYLQVKRALLQRIEARHWPPGQALPNERDLAGELQVSIGTLRRAVDELVHEHVLVRRQGKGTFVATHAEQHVQYRFLKLQPDNGDTQSEGPAERTTKFSAASSSMALRTVPWLTRKRAAKSISLGMTSPGFHSPDCRLCRMRPLICWYSGLKAGPGAPKASPPAKSGLVLVAKEGADEVAIFRLRTQCVSSLSSSYHIFYKT
jgi:DNA-binding transcriptional regulator YhcF (GntR family)